MVINPIVGLYIPIIRIPIKVGMTIPNTRSWSTLAHMKMFHLAILVFRGKKKSCPVIITDYKTNSFSHGFSWDPQILITNRKKKTSAKIEVFPSTSPEAFWHLGPKMTKIPGFSLALGHSRSGTELHTTSMNMYTLYTVPWKSSRLLSP